MLCTAFLQILLSYARLVMRSLFHYLEQAASMFHVLLQSGREPEIRWALSRYQLLNPIHLQCIASRHLSPSYPLYFTCCVEGCYSLTIQNMVSDGDECGDLAPRG